MSVDVLEKIYGRVTDVVRKTYGANLTAAAAIADTILSVDSVDDFDAAEGGQVVIDDELYDYTTVDEDALTITLDTGLLAAAPEGTIVQLYDPEVEGIVVEYVANVLLDDQDPGDEPIEVTVQHGLVNMLAEAVRGRAAEAVVLIRDGEDDWMIWQIDGKLAVDVIIEELKGGYPGTLQDIYDAADAAAAAAAAAAASATTALTAANGKNVIWVSTAAPGATPNTVGDTWWRKDAATQTIIGQWYGLGGTSWQQVTLNDQVIANLDAGKLVAGSAFTNSLSVKTNFTLGDAAVNGVIQSYNFAGSSVGVYIDKFGLVAKGGSVTGADLIGGRLISTGLGTVTIENGQIKVGTSGGVIYDASPYDLFLSVSGAGIGLSSLGIDLGGTINPTAGDADFANGINANGAIHAALSLFDDSLNGGGGTGANINNNGKIIRTPPSAEKYKENIRDLEVDVDTFMSLRSVIFDYRDGVLDDPTPAERFDQPGHIADEMHELGFTHLVAYRDGEVETIRRELMEAYHHVVLQQHHTRLAELEAADRAKDELIADLVARIEALEEG